MKLWYFVISSHFLKIYCMWIFRSKILWQPKNSGGTRIISSPAEIFPSLIRTKLTPTIGLSLYFSINSRSRPCANRNLRSVVSGSLSSLFSHVSGSIVVKILKFRGQFIWMKFYPCENLLPLPSSARLGNCKNRVSNVKLSNPVILSPSFSVLGLNNYIWSKRSHSIILSRNFCVNIS